MAKHSFPEDVDVVCSLHADEVTQHLVDILIKSCEENEVEIDSDTLEEMIDPRYPYYIWNYSSGKITQSRTANCTSCRRIVVSFDIFLKFIQGKAILEGDGEIRDSHIGTITYDNILPTPTPTKSKPSFLY